jgi:hypothetical protein
MQPYLFSYLGYWQLIKAVDNFVVYDDVNFIKGGWINRNYILNKKQLLMLTLSLSKASQNNKINETMILDANYNRDNILKSIKSCYGKAKNFKEIFPLIEKVITFENNNLSQFLFNQLKEICIYLGIETNILLSSNIEKNNDLKGQDKVIEICRKLKADNYINAIGGQELYDRHDFEASGIKLEFIKMDDIKYKQFGNDFIANLSIIDVMMFNSKDEIKTMLDKYTLV